MDHFRIPNGSQGTRSRSSGSAQFLTALCVLSAFGTLALLTPATHGASPAEMPAPIRAALPAPYVTHGDLVVGPSNSPMLLSPVTTGSTTYFEQGNITVLPGGVLTVQNLSVVMHQFIGATGSVAQRYAHLYHIAVQGSMSLQNSTLTTDTSTTNAFPKLTVDVASGGGLFVDHSSLRFPGALNIDGSGSVLDVNASGVAPNPGTATLSSNITVQADTLYAPTLLVTGGARATFGNSSYTSYYADNVAKYGMPAAAPVTDSSSQTLTGSTGATWNSFAVPSDPVSLARAALYPQVAAANLLINYDASATTSTSGTSSFSFLSTQNFPGSLSFASGPGTLQVSLPTGTVAEINSAGVPGFLSALDAGTAGLSLSAVAGGATVSISSVTISLTPLMQYNFVVRGSGSTLTAADSTFDLNWSLTSAAPWNSTKVLLEQGATGFFGSLSTSYPNSGSYNQSSAIVPDATSTANFYRWLAVPVVGAGDQPVADAQLTAFYAYPANQSANATATALNVLPTADADLSAYVTAKAEAAGQPGYGISGAAGIASLLLASTQLTNSTLPDGGFVGNYHAAVSLSGGGAASVRWFSASVTPYPEGMSPAGPDTAPAVSYSAYVPKVAVGAINVTVSGASQETVDVPIGQTLSASVTITSTGSAPVNTVKVAFLYADPFSFSLFQVAPNVTVGPLAVGESTMVNFTWSVNQTVVGLHGTFATQFVVMAIWDLGIAPVGGTTTGGFNATIEPALIDFQFTPPSGSVTPSTTQAYAATAYVNWSGNGTALVNVTAIGPSGRFRLLTTSVLDNATAHLALFFPLAMGAGSYAINATAFFNNRTVDLQFPNQVTVPPPSTAPPPFWLLTFLGEPVWTWIVIALAAIGAIVLFMFFARRTAKGKVVECGECGSLIPENAPACPKCGAEFETDMVRCSRCGSTIPASSEVCPECAAVLLAKGGAAETDPERQGYADFVERFRVAAKKYLGDNYGEGAFWDWGKRQPTYVPFNQWKLNQAQGTRAGMTAPTMGAAERSAPPRGPPRGGAGGGTPAGRARPPGSSGSRGTARGAAPTAPAPSPEPVEEEPEAEAGTTGAAGTAPMKACSNCGKEIPPDFLVCPFCGAVSR